MATIADKISALMALAEGNPAAMIEVAYLMRKNGQAEQALGLCRKAIALAPTDAELMAQANWFLSRYVPAWHFPIVHDYTRNAAYDAALRRAIRPNSRVLEIGTGTGLLAMMAARAGAAQVVTCEMNPAIAETAIEIIARNGFANRVRVIAKHSDALDVEADLGGRVDILVSEIVSNDLLGEDVLPAHERAVRRLLKPGGQVIPARGVIRVAIAEDLRDDSERLGNIDGFDLSVFNRFMPPVRLIRVGHERLKLRSHPADLFAFDFTAREFCAPARTSAFCEATGGRANGIASWFKLKLDEKTHYENFPGPDATSCWAARFVPLPSPINPSRGQKVRIFGSHDRCRISVWCDPKDSPICRPFNMTFERASMHNYRFSGLQVSSELELPGAIPEASQAEAADVTIRRGTVPASLDGAVASGPNWNIADEKFLLRVPGVARFLIVHGREIIVQLESGVKERDAASFILGTSLGALLHQRGTLVLHGAAVAFEGRAIAICGASGAGKSTLAAALCRTGCSFVTDDICVIGLNGHGEATVQSDGRQLRLWREAITNLNLGEQRGEAVRETFEKYYVHPFNRVAEPPKLSAIYVLRESRPPLQTGIENLALADAMRVLEYQYYRPRLFAKIGSKSKMLAVGAAVFGHAKAFRLIRPRGFEYMEETVEGLRKHWGTLGR